MYSISRLMSSSDSRNSAPLGSCDGIRGLLAIMNKHNRNSVHRYPFTYLMIEAFEYAKFLDSYFNME